MSPSLPSARPRRASAEPAPGPTTGSAWRRRRSRPPRRRPAAVRRRTGFPSKQPRGSAMLPLIAATMMTVPPVTAGDSIWLIDPTGDDRNVLRCPGIDFFDRSNNNVALKYNHADGRLYLAVRSAPHHHPRPPLWAVAPSDRAARLYVLSTPFRPAERRRLATGGSAPWEWRLEFEAGDRLEREWFAPLR